MNETFNVSFRHCESCTCSPLCPCGCGHLRALHVERSRLGEVVNGWEVIGDHPYCDLDKPGYRARSRRFTLVKGDTTETIYRGDDTLAEWAASR